MWQFVATIAVLLTCSTSRAQVRTGLDELVTTNFKELAGKHIALIANQTSATFDGRFGPLLFQQSKIVKLVALFAPEHGLMGTRSAGVSSDSLEWFHGVPVYSLYGSTRRPTKRMLRGVNAIVFDLQDIGVRPYTYLSTMIETMAAAVEAKLPFYLLDRPNPLSGARIEGNLLEPELKSFIGVAQIPYLHGMTFGELAKMAVAEGWFANAKKLKLHVVAMQGWKRAMYWTQTGLKWIATSPNIPHFENALGAAALGATGELGVLTIGIGGEKPFLALSTPLARPASLLDAALAAFPHEITFRSDSFYAVIGGIKKKVGGYAIVMPSDLAHLGPLYAPQFQLLAQLMKDSVFRASFDGISTSQMLMFEKATGTKQIWNALDAMKDLTPVMDRMSNDVAQFATRRKTYLIYQ